VSRLTSATTHGEATSRTASLSPTPRLAIDVRREHQVKFYTRNVRWHPLLIAGSNSIIVALISSSGDEGLFDPVLLFLFAVVGVLVAIGVRCAFLRIEVEGRHVKVTNLASRHRIDVCDVEHVDLVGSASGGAIKAGLFLADGSVIECDAVQAPWLRTLTYARRRGQGAQVLGELWTAITEAKERECKG
jgi:hypothetical protein